MDEDIKNPMDPAMPQGEIKKEEPPKKESKGGMTVREAGRKGGEKVRDQRGHEFYEEIGRKGGEAVRDERGHEFYEEIGHKGGQKVKELIEAGKKKAT